MFIIAVEMCFKNTASHLNLKQKPMLSPLCNDRTILLIDDDEDDCFLFRSAMSTIDPNLAVKSTFSADDLFIVLERTNPSIIFIDLHLPKQNGFECLRLIRSHADFKNIPVVFWSGSVDKRNVTSAYDQGAWYYFQKPYRMNDLVEELKKVLSNHNTSEHLACGSVPRRMLDSCIATC